MPRLPVLLVLLAALPARAGDIVGYALDPGRYDRFSSGFPANPVPTAAANFLGAGLDLSGIGWLAGDQRTGVTLIADRYIIGSAHNGFGVGSGVNFLGASGVQSFTVDQVTRITPAGGSVPTDLIVGRLSASTVGTGVTPLPVGQVSQAGVVGQPLLVYGTNPNAPYSSSPHLGTGTVTRVVSGSAFGGADDNVLVEFLRDPAVNGTVQHVPGDSGSPTVVVQDGRAVLLGTHYATGTLPGGDRASYDVFLSEYQMEIEQAAGYQVFFTPVPEPAGLLLAVGVLAWRRRGERGA